MTAAHADDSTVLYVDGSSTSCTDSGTGAEAAPYCTIQAAADAAVAGDTVEVAAGVYRGQVDIKSSGTAAAPIVFQAENGITSILDGTGQTGPALSFDGASYVSFGGALTGRQFVVAGGLQVNASNAITLNGILSTASTAGPDTFHVTGSSTNIALTRSQVGNVLIDAGGSGDVISTNFINGGGSPTGVSISGTTNADITSNTILNIPDARNAISLAAGSTGASIENNIVAYPTGIASTPSVPAVAVDASSTTGTTLDYNVVYPQGSSATSDLTQAPYSWAGNAYASASALFAATGQGAHDLNTNPDLNTLGSRDSSAPQLNSANSSAPGMLDTDLYGAACTIEPLAAVTGAGTPAYCARGAVQPAYTNFVGANPTAQGSLGVSLGTAISQTSTVNKITSQVAIGIPAVSYTIAWGDGQTQTVQSSTTSASTYLTHTYAKVGTYTINDTVTLPDGTTVSNSVPFATAGSGYVPITPTRFLDTRHDIGGANGPLHYGQCTSVQITGVDGIPANATAVAVNLTVTDTVSNGIFFIGYNNTASNLNYSAGQTVANSAIVPLNQNTWGGIPVCSGGDSNASADAIVDVTGYFTQSTSAGYQPMAQQRILDTRSGTGAAKAKIGAKTGLPLAIAGADSIPSGVTAVAVHVTETNATGSGWIAAVPDGSGTPGTSSLNYGKGQTISNTLIVPVAADGKIELYNGALSGSVDLIADVSGYFSAAAPEAFTPVTPFRAVDTRKMDATIPADDIEHFDLDSTLAGADADFPAGATIAANLTATDEKAGGALTVYPTGATVPIASALNHGTNQNIANFGLYTTSGAVDEADVYNNSPGSTDVIFDIFGYFSNN